MHKYPTTSFAPLLFLAAVVVSTIFSPQALLAGGDRPLLQSPAENEQFQLQMWKLINSDRQSPSTTDETNGRAHPLVWDARLAAVARQHSEEMAEHGYFSHQGLDGSLPDARISRAGIQCHASGENIAKYADVAQAEAAFMDEPKFQHNHRSNILSSTYTRVGIGIVKGADGMFYITQEFAGLF